MLGIDQDKLWVGLKAGPPGKLPEAALTVAERAAVAQELRKQMIWSCKPEELDAAWVRNLKVERIPVSRLTTYLIEAGPGCARREEGGAEASTGAMWIVRFVHGRAVFVAGNGSGFTGQFYSLGSASADGWRDVVTFYYGTAADSALNYWRFNGERYEEVSKADLVTDADGKRRITGIRANPQRGYLPIR